MGVINRWNLDFWFSHSISLSPSPCHQHSRRRPLPLPYPRRLLSTTPMTPCAPPSIVTGLLQQVTTTNDAQIASNYDVQIVGNDDKADATSAVPVVAQIEWLVVI